MKANRKEPLAIVGIGFRLPGGIETIESYLDVLTNRKVTVGEVPESRWNAKSFFHPDFKKVGRIHVTRGGYVPDIESFDASFFGISPHEAIRMDPQQRMVLETAFRAIEDAGWRLDAIAGKRVSVVIGCSGQEYCSIETSSSERDLIGATTNTGSALSIISNRVSYMFDFRGPSFTVDTACSSSLTALHHACQTLWNGSCDAALTGGVNALLKPETTMAFSKGGYLSPDGQCRAFSDDANGYVRSEGVGIVVLKRLSDAVANGDRIYALVRGTSLNQDGRTPGMTMPSQEAQEELLRLAYADAGVDPKDVVYVEAHGTGTPVGDPIEASAIGNVIGRSRDQGTCYIGSVKTNIGHLESGAGMAGLIKLILSLKNRTVYPNACFRAPNPKIPFEQLQLKVPVEPVAIAKQGPLFGGVNSFGFGGANAHAVLESPPETTIKAENVSKGEINVLFISARSQSALKARSKGVAEVLKGGQVDLASLANTLCRRHSAFEFRLAVSGDGSAAIADALEKYSNGLAEIPGVYSGRYSEDLPPQKVSFLFSGQGPQWWGMGRKLYQISETFRKVLHQVDTELKALGWLASENGSLLNELIKDEATSRIGETRIAQPAIFALQMGLAEILKEHGVTPTAVMGHSIGELAAAATAGILSLSEATRIVYWRSQSQAMAEGKGVMAAVGLSPDAVAPLMAEIGEGIELAAINGPAAVTVAGLHEPMERFIGLLQKQNVFHRKLSVSVPFHCFLMDPIEDHFRKGLGKIATAPGHLPFYSSVTGSLLEGHALNIDYWYNNIREKVAFYPALTEMLKAGQAHFVEVGPHPVVRRESLEAMKVAKVKGSVIPTLTHTDDDSLSYARFIGSLFASGVKCSARPASAPILDFIEVPGHPFERKPYWIETAQAKSERTLAGRRLHPHVRKITHGLASKDAIDIELSFDAVAETYLADHYVQGVIVVPAAAQIELVLSAARNALEASSKNFAGYSIDNIEFKKALVLPEQADGSLFRLEMASDQGYFQVASSKGEGASWEVHSSGRINLSENRSIFAPFDFKGIQKRLPKQIPTKELFETVGKSGLELGPSFQGLSELWTSGQESVARITVPKEVVDDSSRFTIHPGLVDSIIQTAFGVVVDPDEVENKVARGLFLPYKMGRVRFYKPLGAGKVILGYAKRTMRSEDEIIVDVFSMTEDGEPLAEINGLVLKHIRGSSMSDIYDGSVFYRTNWQSRPIEKEPQLQMAKGAWIVFGNGPTCKLTGAVVTHLEKLGAKVINIAAADKTDLNAAHPTVDPCDEEGGQKVLQMVKAMTMVEGVVHLWLANQNLDVSTPSVTQTVGTEWLANFVRVLDDEGKWNHARAQVWVVTAGGHEAPGQEESKLNPHLGSVIGFQRVLRSEYSQLSTALIDLPMSWGEQEIAATCRELAHGVTHSEVALRGKDRFTLLVERAHIEGSRGKMKVDVDHTHFTALVETPGVIQSVCLQQTVPPSLGAEQIEVKAHSVGLNFKDVVVALAMVDGEAWEGGMTGADPGMECSGVVTRVGAKVKDFKIGDEVVSVAPRALSNRVVAYEKLSVKKSSKISHAQAAGIPMVYLTAAVALERLAHLRKGETVLIHAAAGGVGLAAIQIAKKIGANVIATAGSEEKQAFLRKLGVEHIFSSRNTDFHYGVMEVTKGKGVDVVLNSLSGRMMNQTFLCMAPFGRFVEIGKTDIYANKHLGLQIFGKNRAYFCLDINRWLDGKRDEINEVLSECMTAVNAGQFQALPITQFPIAKSAEALQFLAQAKHIGKVVVDVPLSGQVEIEPSHNLSLDAEGTYVLFGGTKGYGLATAEWLARKGARNVVLVSRSGAVAGNDIHTVDSMKNHGVNVRVEACDITNRASLKALIKKISATSKISGMVHAAVVLDDAPISQLNVDRMRTVFEPKATAAWYLYEESKSLQLDFLLFFSSISSVLGTPGQANYAAANGYLDTLARFSRKNGVPAFAVNWGVLGGTGLVARASADQRRKITSRGVDSFSPDEVFLMMEKVLLSGESSVVAARIDWAKLSNFIKDERLAEVSKSAKGSSGHENDNVLESVMALPEGERSHKLGFVIAKYASQISGLAQENVDAETSLSRYGLDSLMAFQIHGWLQENFGVTIPLVQLLRGPSSVELATQILDKHVSKAIKAASA